LPNYPHLVDANSAEFFRVARQTRSALAPEIQEHMNIKTKNAAFTLAAVLVASSTLIGSAAAAPLHNAVPPACAPPPPSSGPSAPQELKPTTINTIGQAYYCILDNYFSGPVLDARSLLVPAFAALTQELQRRDLDQPVATLPAFSGKRSKIDDDWAAFSQVYEEIMARLPQDPAVLQAVAAATMQAMVKSLNDNHAQWLRGFSFNLTGLTLSGIVGPGHLDPAATAPLYVIAVGGPAASAGIRPGDEIVAINELPPYVNGVLSPGVLKWVTTEARPGIPVNLTLHRPVTDSTFTVTLMPAPSPPPLPTNDARLVNGNIAYVKMANFAPGAGDRVLAAISGLRRSTTLRGVIVDLRGNWGGIDAERAKMLGALAHDKITNYWCDVKDRCAEVRTDDSVPLLNLPFVALIDRRCASACDSFASAVKDLHIGTLVGTRTAGEVAGPGDLYLLEDGSAIMLPKFHEFAANGELVDTIGVAADYHAPVTAADLSAGRDAGLARAIELLR
jgi:carboxyl-terminal processing protease